MSVEDIAPDWLEFIRPDDWGIEWKNPPVVERLGDEETFIHHTAGSQKGTDHREAMRAGQVSAWNRGYSTTAYDVQVHSDLAPGDAEHVAVCGIREKWRSAATRDRNEEGEAICLVGYFHPGHKLSRQPTEREVEALAWAFAWSMEQGWSSRTSRLLGHRDNPAHPDATACPGDFLDPHLSKIDQRAREILALSELPDPIDPNPEPEMDVYEILWKHPDDPHVFWVRGASVLHVSGVMRRALLDRGVVQVEEPNDYVLASYKRHASTG